MRFYGFYLTRGSRNPNKWEKNPTVTVQASDEEDAWAQFNEWNSVAIPGVPDGHWVKCEVIEDV